MAGRSTRSFDIVELSRFERALIEKRIESDADELVLIEQLSHVVVQNREYSGVGVFVNLEITAAAPRVQGSPNRAITGDIQLVHPTWEYGGTTVLFLKNGVLSMLECATIGDDPWPSDGSLFEIVIQNGQRSTH